VSTQVVPYVDESVSLQIRMARHPKELIKEARLCADELMRAVVKNEWAIKLGGKKPHLMYEAWAFLAAAYHITPRIVPGLTRLITIGDVMGFEAEAEAYHVPNRLVISTGNAMCLNDEENWGLRAKYEWSGPNGNRSRTKVGETPTPLFQLRSMAQTRAAAKALKGPLSWIVAMAGFEPTAAEEGVRENEESDPQQPPMRTPQAKPTSADSSKLITDKQASRIWGLAHTAGKSPEEVTAIIKHFGFAQPKEVTADAYDKVCAEISKSDSAP
jgi:hypothetical protein